MGLSAGPVPPRVDANTKAGLLDLLDHAAAAGWSTLSSRFHTLEPRTPSPASWLLNLDSPET